MSCCVLRSITRRPGADRPGPDARRRKGPVAVVAVHRDSRRLLKAAEIPHRTATTATGPFRRRQGQVGLRQAIWLSSAERSMTTSGSFRKSTLRVTRPIAPRADTSRRSTGNGRSISQPGDGRGASILPSPDRFRLRWVPCSDCNIYTQRRDCRYCQPRRVSSLAPVQGVLRRVTPGYYFSETSKERLALDCITASRLSM